MSMIPGPSVPPPPTITSVPFGGPYSGGAAGCAIVTSDTIWSPAKAAEFVARMEAREIDVVVGTQLVTKGYHFPNLTLVGVVDADLGLAGGDLRAAERTFQQIRQVSGRAGRGEKPGRVYVQTHQPDAPVMRALVSGDATSFYAAETQARREAGMPPFGRLAAIVVSSGACSAGTGISTAVGMARGDSLRGEGYHSKSAPKGRRGAAEPPPED